MRGQLTSDPTFSFPLSNAMLLVRRTLGKFSTPPLSRRLSSRATAVLSALDIPTTTVELPGVYDGEWKGSGEVFESVCPATGEVLARIKSVSCFPSGLQYVERCWWLGPACLTITTKSLLLPHNHTVSGITSGSPWRTGEDKRSIRLFQKYTCAKERRDNTPNSRGSSCQGALL